MRVKSTLLTAIAAGIVFLGGMIILGKNPFTKKEQLKRDYVELPKVEIIGEIDKTSGPRENVWDKVAGIDFKETTIKETTLKEDERVERGKLIELLQSVMIDSQRETVLVRKKDAEVSRDKRKVTAYTGHHMSMTKNQKQSHNIREPSVGRVIQLAKYEEAEGDKGG